MCPDGECLVAAIEAQTKRLAKRDLPLAQRREALKFLVHFVADAHQPLHAGFYADRGGNRFQISYQREGWNLHSVWDSLILRSGERSDGAYLAAMEGTLSVPPLQGTAARWTEASCEIVQQPDFYPPKHLIKRQYLDQNRPLALRQLALAGARLAGLLNAVLGEAPVAVVPSSAPTAPAAPASAHATR